MAKVKEVFVCEDYFYCSICLEIYNKPRTLPCLHSFCHSCLTGYIQKILDKQDVEKLICPVCRADTKTDNVRFKHGEKWVENFPINFTLLSILNERKLRMNPKENNCDPCLREETKVKAIVYCYDCSEKLCEECKRHHNKSKLSSNHKLIDVKNGEDELKMQEMEYFSNLSKCQKHISEVVRYLCRDHDQLCCNECAIAAHRKCEDLVSLADEVKRRAEGESDIQKRLELVGNYADKLGEHETKFISNLNIKEDEVKSILKNFKVKLDDTYNELENRIMSELSTRKLALSKTSSLQREKTEKLKDDTRQSIEKLKKSSEFGTATHMFLLEREMGELVHKYEETFTGLRQKSSKTSLVLVEADPIQEAIKYVNNLFRLEETMTETCLPSLAEDFRQRKMTLINEFQIARAQPRYCLWIENFIVITFEYASKIIAYNAADGSLLSSYECHSPTALTAIGNDEFAVCLQQPNRIDIMKIHQYQLSFVRNLANSKSEMITYNSKNKHLYAMSRSEGVIRTFTLDGKDAGVISLRDIDRNYIQNTYNIFFDSTHNHLYISSHITCKLLCINMSGQLVFQYGIQYPWCVITDTRGNVYVASYRNTIQQLTPEGQLLREIISASDNVQYPMGIAFNKQMDRVVITCDSPQRMKIYQFE